MRSERPRTRAILPATVLALLLLVPSLARATAPVVAIVKSSALGPFNQATAAIVAALARDPLQPEILTFDLEGDEANAPAILVKIRDAHPSVVVTVGSLATSTMLAAGPAEPVVFSMVLYPEQSGFRSSAGRGVTGASLDIPVELQFGYLRRLLPTAKRIGVLFDPTETGTVVEEARAAAPKHGFTLIAKALDRGADSVQALNALMEDVDLVWAVADSHVFTPQTTSALILATLRRRVPLIGLSAAHVRAGALAALYCDYEDNGREAATATLRVLHGEKAGGIPVSPPRRVGLALNLHTAEHLGVAVVPELTKEAGEVVR